MTWLFRDSLFQRHLTGDHPERPQRLERIDRKLDASELPAACETTAWAPISRELLEKRHGADYIASVQAAAESGGGRLDADTVVSQDSFAAALVAAGAGCEAVRQVLARPSPDNALCLLRPPGHHALPDRAMGFCLFNNVALAAQAALDQGLDRVLIVDWDVHHGNGTQDAFYENEQVGFCSIHRWPFYPGTGDREETGAGPGLGANCNVPVSFGTPRRDYFDLFERALTDIAARLEPQLLLVSAGFDSHRLDPIGSLGLETEDFAKLTDIALAVAAEHCGGKLVSLLEGGYNIDVLPDCVETHLRRLLTVASRA